MEYLDILDENGNKTGIAKLREEVHKDGDWHKVAFIFVVNDKGEILLQKRSKEKESNPNKWTASASGHLSAGDSDIDGAIRELEEEIGIKANAEDLKYLFTVKEQHINPEKNRNVRHISIVYLLFKNINVSNLDYKRKKCQMLNMFIIKNSKK